MWLLFNAPKLPKPAMKTTPIYREMDKTRGEWKSGTNSGFICKLLVEYLYEMKKITGIIDEIGFPSIPEVTIINPLNNVGIKVSSIIDTGAAGLHIKSDIITLLDLKKIDGAVAVHPILGRQPIDIFEIAIEIQGLDFGKIPVRTMLNEFPYDLIIGCGFIKDGKMVYDGVDRTVEITV